MQTKRIIAAVIQKGNTFLIAQRGKKDSNFEKWEFPGGKVEQNETDHQCLQRELFEELGIVAEIGDYLCSIQFTHNNQSMEMIAYFVPAFNGTITLHEHLAIEWVTPDVMHKFDFPEPDLPIVEALMQRCL